MQRFRLRAAAMALPFLFVNLAPPALAQDAPPPPPQSGPPGAPVASPEQLDRMLAPIALYPDTLLTQILMASTYPLDVVSASRWLQDPNNAALRGDQLVAALQPLPWEPSVKALVPFPQIITMMNNDLDWMQSLGTAFTNQQADVMNEVQGLRQRARQAGRLQSTPQMVVHDDGPAIVIEPADPEVVYVPVYDPLVVYGNWWWPGRPYFFAPPPGFYLGGALGIGIGFSVGFGVVGPLWGWAHPNWGGHNVSINTTVYNHITNVSGGGRLAGSTWQHVGRPGGSFNAGAGAGHVASFHPPHTGLGSSGGGPGAHAGAAGHPGGGNRPGGHIGNGPGAHNAGLGANHTPGHGPEGEAHAGNHPTGVPHQPHAAAAHQGGGQHPPGGGGHPPGGGGGHPPGGGGGGHPGAAHPAAARAAPAPHNGGGGGHPAPHGNAGQHHDR